MKQSVVVPPTLFAPMRRRKLTQLMSAPETVEAEVMCLDSGALVFNAHCLELPADVQWVMFWGTENAASD